MPTVDQLTGTSTVAIGSGGYLRIAQRFSQMVPCTITRFDWYIDKSSGLTGTAYCRIRKVSDDSIIGTLDSVDVATEVSTTAGYVSFQGSVANPTTQDIYVTLEFSNGHCLTAYLITPSAIGSGSYFSDSYHAQYISSWTTYTAYDSRWRNFIFTLTAPIVLTSDPTNITTSGATLEGSITHDGVQTVDRVGFVWKTGAAGGDPGDSDPDGGAGDYPNGWKSDNGDYGENPFDHAVTGLSGVITYRYRACAHNSQGWAYGDEVSFTTLATHRISNASSSGIKIGGVLIPDTAKVYIVDDLTDTVVLKNPVSGFFTNDVYAASGVCPHVHAVCVHETRATLAATNITYTAVKNAAGAPLYFPGREGNKIRVKHQTGGSLSVSCTDNRGTTGYYDVTITYVADTTTASEVSAALAAHSTAKYVISASTGSGKVDSCDFTALSGGEYYTSSAHVFVTPTKIT